MKTAQLLFSGISSIILLGIIYLFLLSAAFIYSEFSYYSVLLDLDLYRVGIIFFSTLVIYYLSIWFFPLYIISILSVLFHELMHVFSGLLTGGILSFELHITKDRLTANTNLRYTTIFSSLAPFLFSVNVIYYALAYYLLTADFAMDFAFIFLAWHLAIHIPFFFRKNHPDFKSSGYLFSIFLFVASTVIHLRLIFELSLGRSLRQIFLMDFALIPELLKVLL